MNIKSLFVFIISFCLLSIAAFLFREKISYILKPVSTSRPSPIEQSEIYQGISYQAVDQNAFEVSILSSNLVAPTRIKITPDRKYLLVSQITGEIFVFPRTDNGWGKPYQLLKIDTKFPGFPPDEAGLVGMVFSKDYLKNGKLFLLYTFRDQSGETQNRISATVLSEKEGKLIASSPKQIYEDNFKGTGSHQITDGVSVNVNGQPNLLFLVGEGFDGKRSQDASSDGGKLLLIKEDGSSPSGQRPFSQNPKVQALGIRNGYALAINSFDKDNRILITDTGPDKYDRLIYTNPFGSKSLNFGWDGNEEKLKRRVPDPNFPEVNDMVIYRLPETRTFTGLSFHSGKGAIPKSDENSQSILVTLFGKTGSKENNPGKEILLGKLTNLSGQPKISFQTIIRRSPSGDGKLGNPLGLEVDPKEGDFFFADILEGRVYWVKVKGGDNNE